MNLSRALVLGSLLVGTALLTACPNVNLTGGVEVPAKGTTVTQEIYAKFVPAPKVGQKWTYVATFTQPDAEPQTATMTNEVEKIEGDVITTTMTTLSEGQTSPLTATSTSSVSKPLNLDEGATMTSEGSEDVTVPFKAYTKAAKFKTVKDGQTLYTVWLVPGVGLVKLSSDSEDGGLYTMELKDFKQP